MFIVTLDDVCSHPVTGFLWSICGPFSIGADVDYGQIVKFYDAEPIGPGRYRPAPEDVEAFLVTSLKISSAKETLRPYHSTFIVVPRLRKQAHQSRSEASPIQSLAKENTPATLLMRLLMYCGPLRRKICNSSKPLHL